MRECQAGAQRSCPSYKVWSDTSPGVAGKGFSPVPSFPSFALSVFFSSACTLISVQMLAGRLNWLWFVVHRNDLKKKKTNNKTWLLFESYHDLSTCLNTLFSNKSICISTTYLHIAPLLQRKVAPCISTTFDLIY